MFGLDVLNVKSFKDILTVNYVEPKVGYEFTHNLTMEESSGYFPLIFIAGALESEPTNTITVLTS